MDIYVVQPGDSISSIAYKYGITVERLISDNGLINPNDLVPGQTLVILYAQKTYTVKQGDTLMMIAESNGISLMQLLRNNPFLYARDYIYPGESIVINYGSNRSIQVNGFTYVFIDNNILKRTLPYLTFISVFNYRIAENANIVSYGDDANIIQTAKDYDTIPLLMISAFSPIGELDIEFVYELLLNEEKQDKIVNEMLQIVRTKGFSGINALISNITESNQGLYLNVLTKLSKALRNEGYIFMLTINPDINKAFDTPSYENLDYISISKIVDRLIFMKNIWGTNKEPPGPVSNISLIRPFVEYITNIISPNMISIGKPLIGYDWTLPFIPGTSYARSISLDTAILLAHENRVIIQFDDESQTPYYDYTLAYVGPPENHIVWFIDARSIKALDDVIIDYNLVGSGVWSLTSYNQQLWSIINASFSIVKFPEHSE
jgi:spore germination protein